MFHSYSHIYLSPHYDDASLSCGGAIHQQTQGGQAALVVTICAAPPPSGEPLSPFAQSLHYAWGNPADVIATREAEDRASLEILGADYLRLNFNDCIYRGHPERGQWFYTHDADLFGSIHPDDLPLVSKIEKALLELIPAEPGMLIYAPLGVGHHIDHQLVHAAAWELRRQGWTIAFYEDYPYADPDSRYAAAGWGHTLETTLAALKATPLQPQLRFLSEENLQAKIQSIRAYASQTPTLFETQADIGQRLRAYALRVGEGKLAERLWLPG
ncbi:MAG: PIG-L family deacetylase [Anaerolineae bacterium]|nr:PIG-L family deacetylase [Anaerolineae bacterium]